jgi:uncharacterized membrane protein
VLDAKKARRHGAAWQGFARATSDIPFLAILEGRQRLVASEIGWGRLLLAAVLLVATLALHPGMLS